jgi:8-oxo-dGTP pyrophosphatase MutT (NUDIX family)
MDDQERTLYRGTVCVIRPNEKYLMRFQETGINAGCWIFPGGSYKLRPNKRRIELGVECATRETQEEIGVNPLNPILIGRVFFDNRFRIFPGKRKRATFDYDADYYFTEKYEGEFKDIGPEPEKMRQEAFGFTEAIKLPMHEGDRAILRWIEHRRNSRPFSAVIVHRGKKLERAFFTGI